MNQICVILALLMAFLPVGGTPVWDRVPAVVETAEPQPLDEAAADYLGVWIAYKLEAGGAAFDPETMGISLTVTLNADGTYALSSAGEEPESGAWRMTEEGARLDELMDDALLTLTDDGFLVTEEEGMALYFYKEGAEKPETAGPQPVGEAGAAYVGEWALEHIIMGGYQYNPALLGVESMTLILNADGAFSLIDADGEEQTGPWTADENGASLMGILPLSLDEEGRLSLEEDGLVLVFARADETPAPAETDSALYLGKWIAFEMGTENGTKIDPALMGMEISLAITADGAYELVSNTASEAEAGDWRMTDEGMLLIHKLTVFTGDSVFSELETSIPLTLTEDGFLRMEEEGIALLFYKEGAEKPETTILQPPGEAGAPFVGEWTLEQVYWGGEAAFDALNPPSGFLNLYEDGACLFSFDDEEEHSGVWTADENAVYFVGMFPMTLDADGRLTVDEGDSQLVFVRADEAPVPTDAEIARYVGTWIAYEAEMGGVRASVEMMGLEFTVTLNADGTLEENDGTVGTWRVTDEGAYLAEDGAETEYLMTMTDDGFLTAEVMGIRAYFYKEGTEKPETAGPQPVGDAGAAYVGEWVLSSLSMGGSTFSAADFGMTMSLTLNADGTFAMIDAEGEAQSGPWTADENGAFLMGMLPMALDADGHLVIEEDGAQMIFVHPGEEPPAPAPVDTPELDERCAPYVGEWHAVWIVNSSNEFDPRENWGIDIVLTLNADGTGEMDYMGSDGGSHWGWNEDKGCAYYGAWDDGIIPTTLSLEGELLMYGTPEEGYTLLSRDADAVYQSEPTPAPADDTDFVIDEETGLISAYVGEGGEVVVPAVINGVAVQGFEDWVFNGNDEVTAITLPEGITVLSYFGNDMENLRSVTLPESLLFIGDGSFQSPEAVEEITIPANVRYIGEFFLSYAYELKTITFEGECPVIINAFQRVPEDVVAYVPDDQLEAYTALLAEFGIGDVRPSGKNAPARVLQFNRDDFEFDAATGTVTAYTGTDAVVEIPAEIDGAAVRAIGAEAFADNWDVRYVGLPEGLETIGGNAFKYCGAVYVKLPSTLRGIASGAFYSYRGARIDLNEGLETIGEGAFAYSSLDYELMLPEGLKVIGAEAFAHSILLDEVYFPATLERIEEKAFYDDGIMYAAFAGYEVPEIAADAFGGDQLEYLADIDTPWDITRAQWEAYKAVFEPMGFLNLTVWRNNPISALDLTYPDIDCFDEDGYLASYTGDAADVTVYTSVWHGDDNVDTIGVGAGAFKGNQVIRSFYPHHCEWFCEIGDEAFADSMLEYIEMFDSITRIGAGAFRNCKGLAELTLPEFLEEIGEGAFDGCTGLEKVTILCDLSLIPEGSFADCPTVLVRDDATDDEIDSLNARLNREGASRARRVSDPEPQPVSEYGAPYVGTWISFEIVIDGEPLNMDYTLILNEDGTGTAVIGNVSAGGGLWFADENGAWLDDETTLALTEEGYLREEYDEESYILFYREGTEPPKPAQPETVGELGMPYVGEWEISALAVGGMEYSAEVFGLNLSLAMNEDGTFFMTEAGADMGHGTWTADENGITMSDGTPAALDARGLLIVSTQTGDMIFARAGGEEPEPTETPAPTPAPTPEPAAVTFDPIDTRLVATKASSSGFNMDPSMLGGEYAILLHRNGKADFTIAGMEVKDLPWVMDGDDYVVDYYGAMELRFVVVGESLELDYAGSLHLTFTEQK